jgi:hypothetical protein
LHDQNCTCFRLSRHFDEQVRCRIRGTTGILYTINMMEDTDVTQPTLS